MVRDGPMRSRKRIGQWRFFKVSYRSVIIFPLPLDKLVHEKKLGKWHCCVSLCLLYITQILRYITVFLCWWDALHYRAQGTGHVKFMGVRVRHKWTSFFTFIARAQQIARNNNVFIFTTFYEPKYRLTKTPLPYASYFEVILLVSFLLSLLPKPLALFFWGLKPLELWMTKVRWYI